MSPSMGLKTKQVFAMLLALATLSIISGDGFVEEVSCSADSLTVVLNKSDSDIRLWLANPKSQPVAYVYGHKARAPCGMSLRNAQGATTYNLTVPYGKHCDVLLADLEPNYQTAETTIALEDNVNGDTSKPIRINHVFCLYTRSVQTIRFNDVSAGHEVIASTGSKPKPKVEMLFRSTDGRPVRAAKFGDTVGFYLALSPDKAYHGIAPKECMFSDREDMQSPDAKHLTFVQSSCPVDEMSEIIDPLANVNEEVYYSKFKTFRFGNQSTVFAHCTVQVCLNSDECSQKCFKKVNNSNLTAERLRYHHRRRREITQEMRDGTISEVAISSPLTILDDSETEQVTARRPSSSSLDCSPQPVPTLSRSLSTLILLLSLATVSLLLTVFVLARRLRLRSKQLEPMPPCVYSAYAAPSLGRSSMSYTTGLPRTSWVNPSTDLFR